MDGSYNTDLLQKFLSRAPSRDRFFSRPGEGNTAHKKTLDKSVYMV